MQWKYRVQGHEWHLKSGTGDFTRYFVKKARTAIRKVDVLRLDFHIKSKTSAKEGSPCDEVVPEGQGESQRGERP